MKHQFFFLATLLLISLFTAQCKLDYNNSITETTIKTRGCFEISELEADLCGQNHNLALDEIFSNLKCSGLKSADLNQAILSLGSSYDVETNLLNYVINNWADPPSISIEEYDFERAETVESFVSKLESATFNSEDFEDFSLKLDTIKTDVISQLSCFDRTFMLVCISVAKSSAFYWLPASLGGEGNEGPCGTGPPVGLSIWRRIAADWIGAGLSFKPSIWDAFTPTLQTVMDVTRGAAGFSAGDSGNGGGSW